MTGNQVLTENIDALEGIKILMIEDVFTLLIGHAAQDYSGGAGRCAMFLSSLWDGKTNKADLQEILYNDE